MNSTSESLQTLQDIRGIMERSSRFLSLSGWSGVWAGCTALIGAGIAYTWLGRESSRDYSNIYSGNESPLKYIVLAGLVLLVALTGGFYFTVRKAKRDGTTVWARASRQLALQIAIPLAAGGVFAFSLLYYGQPRFVAPACLMFYGLALINGGKHTLGEVRALGFLQLILGCINLFMAQYGLEFWALGFGVLHIVYGILMWRKYDRPSDHDTIS